MTVDVVAVERLVADVTRQFQEGLQKIVGAATREAELERQRISEEALALAQERARLEEARQHLKLEKLRFEISPPEPQDTTVTKEPEEIMQIFQSRGGDDQQSTLQLQPLGLPRVAPLSLNRPLSEHVPRDCAVTLRGSSFTVLPAERPDATHLGHDLWNQTVVVPDGWEVLSAEHRDFDHVLATMTRHCWGAMVLGVRNAAGGYDAYYTPLFQAGNYEGKLCQADVDWIEPVAGNPRSFRMTYSGLRLLIRSRSSMPRNVFEGRCP